MDRCRSQSGKHFWPRSGRAVSIGIDTRATVDGCLFPEKAELTHIPVDAWGKSTFTSVACDIVLTRMGPMTTFSVDGRYGEVRNRHLRRLVLARRIHACRDSERPFGDFMSSVCI